MLLNHGVKPLRKFFDDAGQIGGLYGLSHLFLAYVFQTVGNVFTDGSRKQHRGLRHHRYKPPVAPQVQSLYIFPVDQQFSLRRQDKADQKI